MTKKEFAENIIAQAGRAFNSAADLATYLLTRTDLNATEMRAIYACHSQPDLSPAQLADKLDVSVKTARRALQAVANFVQPANSAGTTLSHSIPDPANFVQPANSAGTTLSHSIPDPPPTCAPARNFDSLPFPKEIHDEGVVVVMQKPEKPMRESPKPACTLALCCLYEQLNARFPQCRDRDLERDLQGRPGYDELLALRAMLHCHEQAEHRDGEGFTANSLRYYLRAIENALDGRKEGKNGRVYSGTTAKISRQTVGGSGGRAHGNAPAPEPDAATRLWLEKLHKASQAVLLAGTTP